MPHSVGAVARAGVRWVAKEIDELNKCIKTPELGQAFSAVALGVLRHRIITNFNAEAEGIKPDDIVRRLADLIPRDPNEEKVAK